MLPELGHAGFRFSLPAGGELVEQNGTGPIHPALPLDRKPHVAETAGLLS